MFTTAGRDSLLTKMDADVSHIGLITAITDWRAGTVTEASYSSYARVAITFGAAADTSPAGGRQMSNSVAALLPQNTGGAQNVIAYGLYSAISAGTLAAIGPLDDDAPIAGTLLASSDVITAYAHGLATDQRVFMLAAPFGAAPDTLTENVAYFVLAAGLTADAFSLSTTSGGAAVNSTVSGAAMFIPYKALTIAGSSAPNFAIGSVVVSL